MGRVPPSSKVNVYIGFKKVVFLTSDLIELYTINKIINRLLGSFLQEIYHILLYLKST